MRAMSLTTRLDLFLVIPPGVDRSLYPWGVQSLSDYVTHFDVAESRIWALGEEPWLTEVFRRYAAPLLETLECLTPTARSVFFGHTSNPYLFLGVVGELGSRVLAIAQRRNILRFPGLSHAKRVRLAATLDDVRLFYQQHLYAGVRSCLELSAQQDEGPGRRVFGITVYDYTLFNSLSVSRVIRELDPAALMLLGGDYFDYKAAPEVLQHMPAVDALVVGYGEEVLRQVLDAYRQDHSIDSLDLPGLVTRASLDRQDRVAAMDAADLALGLGKTSRAERESSVNVPASYRQTAEHPPVNYVQTQDDGTIRILTQRGCSWGKCTFCSQIDRRLFFSLGLEAIITQLETALRKDPLDDTASRHVSLDADENDLNAVLPLLETMSRAPGSYTIEFWLMVRKFGAELPRFLRHVKNLRLQIILNIESFSAQTLKRMKKGVVPLQIVEAIKAVQDAGHVVKTNYFLNYPLEDGASVAQEVALLERVAHLFAPPKMSASTFSYMANTRDEIHFDHAKYGIRARRLREDVWLHEGFGVDLPFSIWTLRCDRPLAGRTLRELVPFLYHKLTFARRTAMLCRNARLVFHHPGSDPMPGRIRQALEGVELQGWRLAYELAQLGARETAYRRRQAFFDYLDAVATAAPSSTLPAAAAPQPVRPSRYFIDGAELVKECLVPGAQQSFRWPLCERELSLLRYLYWCRKYADLARHFAAWEADALARLLSRHQQLGSIISQGPLWLCVVHDPGYWSTVAAQYEGPCARTNLLPREVPLVALSRKQAATS